MKILLIQPPHYYNGLSRKATFFPLGLGYIVKVLKNKGHKVKVLDAWAHQLSFEDTVNSITDNDFDILGLSALSTQYNFVKFISKKVKNRFPGKKIILGGALSTLSYRTVLENTDVDICITGEGEETVVDLLNNVENLKLVNGISFKENGIIVDNPKRKYIENLDSIPFPEYESFPLEIYFRNSFVVGAKKNTKAATVICGRGCPYNCNFCSKIFTGLRLRSIDNIIREIKYLKDAYKIEGIFFADELLVINKKRVYELCEKMSSLGLIWNCQARVNTVDYELLKYMRKSGCVAVGYGIESGSQKILDRMNKMITVDQSKLAIRNTVKAGLLPVIQAMFGYPDEDCSTIKETIDFFKNIDHPAVRFAPTTPLPGTKLYFEASEKGLIKNEKELLESLNGGYMQNVNKILVNFTNFTDEDFFNIKDRMESIINRNYYKKHPFKFLIKIYMSGLDNLRENGVYKTINRLFNFIVEQIKTI